MKRPDRLPASLPRSLAVAGKRPRFTIDLPEARDKAENAERRRQHREDSENTIPEIAEARSRRDCRRQHPAERQDVAEKPTGLGAAAGLVVAHGPNGRRHVRAN